MFFKQFFLSIIVSLLFISPLSLAENICTKEALEQANNQYLQKIASYTSLFVNQQNQTAIAELNNIKPTAAFKVKHAQEIKKFNHHDYQPSQQFCDDLYSNLLDLNIQLSEIINKYSLPEHE